MPLAGGQPKKVVIGHRKKTFCRIRPSQVRYVGRPHCVHKPCAGTSLPVEGGLILCPVNCGDIVWSFPFPQAEQQGEGRGREQKSLAPPTWDGGISCFHRGG